MNKPVPVSLAQISDETISFLCLCTLFGGFVVGFFVAALIFGGIR